MSKPLSTAERQRRRLAKFRRQLPKMRQLRDTAKHAGRWREAERLTAAIAYRERILRLAEPPIETAQL
jgi:hypothetical protein